MKRPLSDVVLTVLMDALVLLAVVVTAGMVAAFFGALESTVWGERLSQVTSAVTVPLGLPQWDTPYGGVFSADSGLTVAIILGIEWFLSVARRRRVRG